MTAGASRNDKSPGTYGNRTNAFATADVTSTRRATSQTTAAARQKRWSVLTAAFTPAI